MHQDLLVVGEEVPIYYWCHGLGHNERQERVGTSADHRNSQHSNRVLHSLIRPFIKMASRMLYQYCTGEKLILSRSPTHDRGGNMVLWNFTDSTLASVRV